MRFLPWVGFVVSAGFVFLGLGAIAPTWICFDECSPVGELAIAALVGSWAAAWTLGFFSWKALKKQQDRWPD